MKKQYLKPATFAHKLRVDLPLLVGSPEDPDPTKDPSAHWGNDPDDVTQEDDYNKIHSIEGPVTNL